MRDGRSHTPRAARSGRGRVRARPAGRAVMALGLVVVGIAVRNELAVELAAREGARAAAVSASPVHGGGRGTRAIVTLPIDVTTTSDADDRHGHRHLHRPRRRRDHRTADRTGHAHRLGHHGRRAAVTRTVADHDHAHHVTTSAVPSSSRSTAASISPSVGTLHGDLSRVVRRHPGDSLLVDLDAVDTLDDAGLGVLLGAAAAARETGGDLEVVCSRPALVERFRRSRFDRAVTVRTTIA